MSWLIFKQTEPASYFPLDPNAKPWAKIWDSVSAINQLAEENDTRFLPLLFPLEFQVLDDKYSTLPQELLTARAAESNILVQDLLPAYRLACQEKPDGACRLEDRYLFADVWMHPSAYGHELTAIEIKAILDRVLELCLVYLILETLRVFFSNRSQLGLS